MMKGRGKRHGGLLRVFHSAERDEGSCGMCSGYRQCKGIGIIIFAEGSWYRLKVLLGRRGSDPEKDVKTVYRRL